MPRKLHYPKIPNSRDFPLGECIAFEKYDGTNMHFSWQRDFGWHAFGTRRDEFNLDDRGIKLFQQRHRHIADAPFVFRNDHMSQINDIFKCDDRCLTTTDFTVFAEFLGPNSFAGLHKDQDAKRLVLFDVQADGELLSPFEFVEIFGELPVARVVYRGKFHGAFTEDVRNGKYGVDEGVICKTGQ
ncbi:RNA ligase family protein [Thalassoglobus sp.]|uniref:RNA ligase family protein n=1 Tax=Thalassoglobus sp. TaxID=2795869 RepID=UPI003AA92F72